MIISSPHYLKHNLEEINVILMLVLELHFRSNENWEMNSPLEDHGTTSEEMSLEPFLREGSGGGGNGRKAPRQDRARAGAIELCCADWSFGILEGAVANEVNWRPHHGKSCCVLRRMDPTV